MTLGSGYGDSYSYDSGTGRRAQYQFTVNCASDTGAFTWNANGSLGTLAIADNIPTTSDSQSCGDTHDDLGRIASAACTGGDNWSQAFSYDALGNVLKSGTQSFQPNYWWARAPARLRRASRLCSRRLGAPWPQVGAALRWSRAEFVSRVGPPCGISQPFAPILPAGKAARPPRWDQQPHFDQHRLRAELRQRRRLAGRPGEHAAKRERLRRRGARGDAGGDRGDV